jgi:hypothetical protein
VQELWESEYKGKYASELPPPPPSYVPINQDDTDWGDLAEYQAIAPTTTATVDRFDKYLSEPPLLYEDSLSYWNKHRLAQPDLARFAYDMLAIPPMSDECERTFSSAKHLINDTRNQLDMDIIEANECLRAWYGGPKYENDNLRPTEEQTERYIRDHLASIEAIAKGERAISGEGLADSDVEDATGILLDADGDVVLNDD